MPDDGRTWRDKLLAANWQQGSLLPTGVDLPFVGWAHPSDAAIRQAKNERMRLKRESGEEITSPYRFERTLRERDRLVVLTHSCDVIKQPEHFPLVEVGLVLVTDNGSVLAQSDDYGSARYYRLSPRRNSGNAYVLDFGWRGQVEKGMLLANAPDNGIVTGWGNEERRRFARWLGRRTMRPVLDECDVRDIQDPIRRAWEQAVRDELDARQAWSSEFAEVRFRRTGPRAVHLYLLSPHPDPDDLLGAEYLEWLGEAVQDASGLTVDGEICSYHHFTIADQETSLQIDLEWASDDEGSLSSPHPPEP